MSKAIAVEVSNIPVARRGRNVELNTELVGDLKEILSGNVAAYNLAGYFTGKDLTDTKVKQAVGQNIRKNWTHTDGVSADSKALRLDFAPDGSGIFARLAAHVTTAPAVKVAKTRKVKA